MEQVNRDELEKAARRIMEMNSKARRAVGTPREEKPPEPKHQREEKGVDIKNIVRHKNSIFDIINFKNFAADADRTLLTGLMLLLGGEMADEKLMLALLYIML